MGFTYGQNLQLSGNVLSAKDDASAPKYGVEFDTDTEAYLQITQDFGGGIVATFDTETYQTGVYNVSLPLDMSIWFEKDPINGDLSTVASTEQYTIRFSDTNSQTVYYDADGKFSLHSPQFYVGGEKSRSAILASPLLLNR